MQLCVVIPAALCLPAERVNGANSEGEWRSRDRQQEQGKNMEDGEREKWRARESEGGKKYYKCTAIENFGVHMGCHLFPMLSLALFVWIGYKL